MTRTVLLATDGSELSIRALRAGFAVLGPAERVVVAIAVPAVDPTLVTGTGFAGGVITPEESAAMHDASVADARTSVDRAARALGLDHAETAVVTGDAGRAVCDLAESLPASVLVIGTRGHGGFRRAVLGSVSDHLVRHAPCPVVVSTGEE
jgi:nucleotide-binding universal stress UspA family protein